jgi:hypothetical protein
MTSSVAGFRKRRAPAEMQSSAGVRTTPFALAGERKEQPRIYQGKRCDSDNRVEVSGHFANRRLTPSIQDFLDLASILIAR